MKLLIFLSIFSSIVSATDIEDIIKSIQKINSDKAIKIPKSIKYDIYDPFSSAKPILNAENKQQKKQTNELSPIILQTTLNHRAFIDGKWYNKGEIVRGYKIQKISKDSVVLVKHSKIKVISIYSVKNILEMKEPKK